MRNQKQECSIILREQEPALIMNGLKTMMRRVVSPQPRRGLICDSINDITWNDTFGHKWECPFGVIGDRLWVKETFAVIDGETLYKADYNYTELAQSAMDFKWKAAHLMTHELSRISIEIVNVRAEELHKITEEDARKEGVKPCFNEEYGPTGIEYRNCFRRTWNFPAQKHPEDSNPWVWVGEFKRIEEESGRAE